MTILHRVEGVGVGLNPLLDPPLHASLSPAPWEEKFHHGFYLGIEWEGGRPR